jgi:predicted Zn-dependent protease
MAHALREHARAEMGKNAATRGAIEIGSALLGLGNLSRAALGAGGQLLSLRFSRDDETEADLIGLELGARAGYDPQAAVSLWQKMAAASKGSGSPEFLSTHPTRESRVRDIEANIPKVQVLYERAEKPAKRFAPPPNE